MEKYTPVLTDDVIKNNGELSDSAPGTSQIPESGCNLQNMFVILSSSTSLIVCDTGD